MIRVMCVLVQYKPLVQEFYKEAINHSTVIKNKQVWAKVCQLQTF